MRRAFTRALRPCSQFSESCTHARASEILAPLEAVHLGSFTEGARSLGTLASNRITGLSSFLQAAPQIPFACWTQTRSMFIQTQSTPNPASLMFLPGKTVMENGTHAIPNARAGMTSPLAKRLFKIDGVSALFLGSDFITVTKKDDDPAFTWAVLKPDIFAAIMDHFSSGDPILLDAEEASRDDTAIHEDDDEIVAMIKELLETRIRPAVQEDGGDIKYKSFDPDTGIVAVNMMGACSGCPSSAVTLKSGIQSMLMHYIPEVTGVVEADAEDSDGSGDGKKEATDPAAEENKLASMLSN